MSVSSISSSDALSTLSSYLSSSSSLTDEEIEEINEKMEEEYAQAVKEAASGSSSSSTSALYANLTESAQDTNDLLNKLKEAADSNDPDTIRETISEFATSYNSLLTYLKSTGSTECSAIISAMTTYLKDNEDALNAAGITISSSGKLTIDSETLESADTTALAEIFSSSSTTMKELSKLSASALSVASMKSSHYEALSSLYDGSGSINTHTLTRTFLDMMS